MRELLVYSGMFLGFGFALFGSTYWALWVYWWVAFFRPQDWAYSDFLAAINFSGSIWACVVIKGFVNGGYSSCLSVFTYCVILVLIGGSFAHLSSYDGKVSFDSLAQFFILSVILILSQSIVDTLELFDRSMRLLTAFVLFHTAKSGLGILLTGSGNIGEGLGGYMPDNNSFGLMAALLTPLIYASGMSIRICNPRYSFLASIFTFILLLLNVASVVFTGSRGAFLALAVAVIAMVAFSQRKLVAMFFVLIALATVIASGVIVSSEYKDRIESITEFQNEDGDASIHSRLHFWKTALDIAQNHPLGVGFRNFGFAYDKYDSTHGLYGLTRPVHNSHLQILTEGGFIAFVAWLVVNLTSLKNLFRSWRLSSLGVDANGKILNLYTSALISSILSFLVGSSFGNYAYNDLFWTLLAMSAILTGLNREGGRRNRKVQV